MTDKTNPRVSVMLDRERYLLFGMRAMRAFEQETSKNLLKLKQMSDLTATEVTVLFWACLLHDDRELTIEQAVELIDEHSSLAEISRLLVKAQGAAMPDVKGDKEKAPLAPRKPRPG